MKLMVKIGIHAVTLSRSRAERKVTVQSRRLARSRTASSCLQLARRRRLEAHVLREGRSYFLVSSPKPISGMECTFLDIANLIGFRVEFRHGSVVRRKERNRLSNPDEQYRHG